MNKIPKVFVGVDVSKNNLDIHINPIEKSFKIENSVSGMKRLIKELALYEVGQVVCESSGGYENLLLETLTRWSIKNWQVDPKRIKAFIASEGVLLKTDKNDAKMIALFASQKRCKYTAHRIYSREKERKLKALVIRKLNLTDMRTMEKLRLGAPTQLYCKKEISASIKFLTKQIKEVEEKINDIIDNDDEFKRKSKILESMPGVGKATASTLISTVSEMGKIENKKIASLVGVCSVNKESGKYRGKARIQGGRPEPRKALYMATLSAIKCNQPLSEFYKRLRGKGKAPKVAIVAVMRKMIVMMNAMIKSNREWAIEA